MKKKIMNIIKTIEPIDLLDGEYQTTWTANEITIHTLDGDVIALTTSTSIRGTFEFDVNIKDGIIYTDRKL